MGYNLRYSDYITPAGPPDPSEWIGPPGPPGPVGPPGMDGEDGVDGTPGDLGFVQATGSTTPRHIDDWMADVANVLAFGADPTGAADSTAAFNAAAAVVAAGSTRRKAVYFPTGVYRINGQINLTACQEFYGDSRGSSVLQVDQAFNPAAVSVIFLTSLFYPLGPFLHDFSITFVQPQDQTSRANFKTLAAGGTSGPGGTGVKYPWAIASGSDSFRIQIARVQIGGAWDGITSNSHNTVFWLDDVEVGALDCGLSLGEGAAILDFSHINGFHFWNFGITGTQPLYNVFIDGQTVAMRVGRVDGLNIKDFSSFVGRLIVTPDSGGQGHIHIVNCMMDTDFATIEINGAMAEFSIANLFGTAASLRPRPFVQVMADCTLHITNYYAHSTSSFPDFVLDDPNAIVTITNFEARFLSPGVHWVEVRHGILRISNGYLLLTGPRTVAAFAETVGGNLAIDNIAVSSAAASGPLVLVTSVGQYTMIGRLSLISGNTWTFSIPAGVAQTNYSPTTSFAGSVFAQGFFATTLFQAGQTGGGNPGNVALFAASNEQHGILLKRAALNGWGILVQGATDDLNIGRWNDAGTFQGNVFSLIRATGAILTPALAASASYASDATAAAGGVAIGQLYRNGSVVQVRVA